MDGTENGEEDKAVAAWLGGWNGLDLAKGLVGERARETAPVGLLRSLGSAMPVGCGSMDWRKGFVDVGWADNGARPGCCIGACPGCIG